jgi:hypothetical protein
LQGWWLATLGWWPALVYGPAAGVAPILKTEGAKWKKVIDEAGIQAD